MSYKIFNSVSQNSDGAPEVTPEELKSNLDNVKLIDVRGSDEYTGELGHIEGAELATLGEDLTKKLGEIKKDEAYVFICRSGKRSTAATLQAKDMGFENVFNMQGGMLRWNALDFPTTK